ncbi:glycosyltransferase [Roseococcus sp. SDR]|uniref:glycosyltransferase n=1 Tax=Roseococcus sp. SDR TaxID=2835532 RepID=UPI001BCDDA75|nr:glycosyltransferase [Roseococcus sp. SDR]MBS7791845.1 glycosyltransferase family 2 protein [Roseococcus sp. SDR]MBV1847159.1 glycosyltransferase [Roseococcus sp. SDR]
MAPPDQDHRIHPLRRAVRRLPGVRKVLLTALKPVMPQVGNLVRWLEAAEYTSWFERWQASTPADDAAILALLGPAPASFLVTLPRADATTQASIAGQIGVAAETLEGGTLEAAQALRSRFVMHLQPGDLLVRHALAEFAIAARAEPAPLVLFADEDGQVIRGARRAPWLKTAFDPDLLLQQPALGRAVAYDTGLLARHGLLGLRGHALMVAATRAALAEAGPAAIRHIPGILLHRAAGCLPPWREELDVAGVSQILAEAGEPVTLEPPRSGRPVPRATWPLPDPAPQVTIIIPTRNGLALMEACLEGLLDRTHYPAFDIIVCDNDSDDPALLRRFEEWSRDPRFAVLPCPGPFNYSVINNRAARAAKGEILLFLNNDTEIRNAGWLREMVSHAVRPEIGAVGARLLFPSLRVQHSGTVLGLAGIAGHDMLHTPQKSHGPYDLLRLTRRVSAVTAACLAVRREAFLAVGGFDEEGLRVAYNDVDLCLKLRAAGLHNLVTPHAELLHKESATRGDDMSPAHKARWLTERATMRARWGDALVTDPYYSPLLSLDPPARILTSAPRRLAPWRAPAEQPPLPD